MREEKSISDEQEIVRGICPVCNQEFENTQKLVNDYYIFNCNICNSELKVKKEDDIKKTFINKKGLAFKIVGIFLILILIFTMWTLFNSTILIFDKYSELSSIENSIQDVKDELNSLNNQINSTEEELSIINSELLLYESAKYEIHNPTYSEVLDFLSKDKTNTKKYELEYTCTFFAMDVNNNAEKEGVRCAFVELDFVDLGHAIVAFETTDKGLVYFEPQDDVKANIRIGSKYHNCLPNWGVPDYDDTIKNIVRYW